MKILLLLGLVPLVTGDATPEIQLVGFQDLYKLTQGYSGGSQEAREDRSLLSAYPFNQGLGVGRQRSSFFSSAAARSQVAGPAIAHAGSTGYSQAGSTARGFSAGFNTIPAGTTLADIGISLGGFGSRTQTAAGYGTVRAPAQAVSHETNQAAAFPAVHRQATIAPAVLPQSAAASVATFPQVSAYPQASVAPAATYPQTALPAPAAPAPAPAVIAAARASLPSVATVDHSDHHVVHDLAHNDHHFQPGQNIVEVSPLARQPLPHVAVQDHLAHADHAVHVDHAVHADPAVVLAPEPDYQLRSQFNPNRARRPALGRDPGPTFETVAVAQERCIDKIEQVEEIEYDDVEECNHSYDKKCHTSYSTEYTNQQEVECEDNYKKECQITYSPSAHNETVRVCMRPLVKDCNLQGPLECRTEYVSECWTINDEHTVVDDVPECTTVYEEKCKNEQSGYTTEQKCTKWPKEVCSVNKQLKKKVTPKTKCEKVPQEFCGPAGCGFVQGPEECIDKVKTIITDIPEEKCDLQPRTNCEHKTKLVPKLVPVEECVDVPKEVCNTVRGPPRTVVKNVTKKWCYTPTQESGLL